MTRKERKKTAQQYLTEERRKQVAIMATQSYSEMEIAKKLGVNNSTISKDIKALKLISKQFIYDITKSDFTFYYKQRLDTKLILRKQCEIVDKEHITRQDMDRAKMLSDILSTVDTINEYYDAAPRMHKTPMQKALDVDRLGVRPGARIHKITEEDWEQLDAGDEAELKAMEEQLQQQQQQQ
jgi:hypothetical protein